MAKYTIESEYCSTFGMDVHARTTTVKGLDRSTGETKTRRFDDVPTPEEIASWMQSEFAGPWYAAYESGCTGFHLCRELRALGIDCDVVAVTSISRSDSDKKRKNDRRDASRLLSELVSPDPTYSVVWTPDLECEAMRDLARAKLDAMAAAKAAKNHVSSMLLRHGIVWNEKAPSGNLRVTWSRDYISWVKAIKLSEQASQATLEFYVQVVIENLERVRMLDAKLVKHSESPRWKPYVDALSMLKGVDWFSALLLACEIGDFRRFKAGRDISNWLGTVPKESSGADNFSRGAITKAGNSHCRTILVEGMAGVSRRNAAMKKMRSGQVVSSEVQAICYRANKRLAERYEHLTKELGKRPNKAKVAVVNELIRWIWVVGCAVQDEREARG